MQKPAASLLIVVYTATVLLAQNSLLHGIVTDDSGAVVPGATVTLAGPAGLEKTAVTGGDGSYTFYALPSGDYVVQASAPQLALPQPRTISLRGGR